MSFPDPNQESQFQEIFDEVNKIDFSVAPVHTHFDESDLRKVFLTGYKHGQLSTVQKFAKSVSKRLKEKD